MATFSDPVRVPLLALILAHFLVNVNANCLNPVSPCNPDEDYFPDKLEIQYSNTIKNLAYRNTFVEFSVLSGNSVYDYRLVKCGCPPGDSLEGHQVIFTSPQFVFIDEGPTLGLFQPLVPDLNSLKYVFKKSYIFSPAIRARVDSGDALEVLGEKEEADYEILSKDSELSVSLIGVFQVESYEQSSVGKPFLAIAEAFEEKPLGRTEWIKVLGLLFERSAEAENLFAQVVRGYEEVQEEAKKDTRKPTVFFGAPFDSSWYVPSGRQYISAFARDANAEYRFADDDEKANKELTYAEVGKYFKDTEVLLNGGPQFPVSDNHTLGEFVESSDEDAASVLRSLTAVKCGNVWSNQKRVSPDNQASDFFELGAYRPDLLLGDYVQILHPSLNTKENLTFMYSLGPATPEVTNAECPIAEVEGESQSSSNVLAIVMPVVVFVIILAFLLIRRLRQPKPKSVSIESDISDLTITVQE